MIFRLENLDLENFDSKTYQMSFGEAVLVIPKIGCKWTQENKIFRSSLWEKESGLLISAGFPKFTNWGENPDIFPLPQKLDNAIVTEKLDGSLLIVSKWKGELIVRTRESIEEKNNRLASEINYFKNSVLKNLLSEYRFKKRDWNFSLLFEWLSPNREIVINYGSSPKFVLIGRVDHSDYSLYTPNELNLFAEKYGFDRPNFYSFPSTKNLLQNVESWKLKEGVCVYSGENYQVIHKVKSLWYLSLHRMKSELSSIDKVADVYFELGRPHFQDFKSFLIHNFDFELFNILEDSIIKIIDCYYQTIEFLAIVELFLENISKLSRKEKAEEIIGSFRDLSGFVFSVLDGKVDDKVRRKIFNKFLAIIDIKIFCTCCGKQAIKKEVSRDDDLVTTLIGAKTMFKSDEFICGFCAEDLDENGLFPEERSQSVNIDALFEKKSDLDISPSSYSSKSLAKKIWSHGLLQGWQN